MRLYRQVDYVSSRQILHIFHALLLKPMFLPNVNTSNHLQRQVKPLGSIDIGKLHPLFHHEFQEYVGQEAYCKKEEIDKAIADRDYVLWKRNGCRDDNREADCQQQAVDTNPRTT